MINAVRPTAIRVTTTARVTRIVTTGFFFTYFSSDTQTICYHNTFTGIFQ